MPRTSCFINRLSSEKSPYLLQHALQPVAWYPWCDEAFDTARLEDKPVFLSIGYSTCHWCHVMAHESFEDDEVARLLNKFFVCIKVDREERPDIDAVYMNVCQMLTGSGGWPLTIIMTPDKQPFFAATYIPKQTRFGRIGMLELLPKVYELWKTQRAKILKAAGEICSLLGTSLKIAADDCSDLPDPHTAYRSLQDSFDKENGGFGAAPKFPTPHTLLFLLRYWKRYGDAVALRMVESTLNGMRAGGIYDHVGFGFHRYSMDPSWIVPHFEKMLYDQALLCMAYTEAYQVTGNELYRKTVDEIITYVCRNLMSENGAFYCAEDADSQEGEGRFYLWTAGEIKEVFSNDDAQLFLSLFNIRDEGNFADEITGRYTGLNILHLSGERGLVQAMKAPQISKMLGKLNAARSRRPRPQKDEKILTDWNGLMVAALAKAGRAMENPAYIVAASKATRWIMDTLGDRSGRLFHRYVGKSAGISGQASDYAFFVWALLELYQATFDPQHLSYASLFTETLLEHFWDYKEGGLFMVADDAETVLVRQKEVYDGAIPSANAVAAYNLFRLSRMTGKTQYEEKAYEICKTFSNLARRNPSSHTMMMVALDFGRGPSSEVFIIGKRKDPTVQSMVKTVNTHYLPNVVLLFRPSTVKDHPLDSIFGFLKDKTTVAGKTKVYVCRGNSCLKPIFDEATLRECLL